LSELVVVTVPLPEPVLGWLGSRYALKIWDQTTQISEDLLAEWVQPAHGVLCSVGTPVTKKVIEAAPALRVISTISVGTDHIDLASAHHCGVPVGFTPDVLVDSTADMAVALMLAVTRRVPEADRFIRNGGWHAGWSTGFFLGTDLSRATVGIIGLGPTGQAVATRLRGFGSRLIGWNRTPRVVEGVELTDLETLFGRADIVTLHTASTPDTYQLVNAARLAAMRDGAILINTARGALVEESALARELASGRLRAGLDVFAEEPLPQDSLLMQLDNVVFTPHLGSATGPTRQAMIERALENLSAGMTEEALPWQVKSE